MLYSLSLYQVVSCGISLIVCILSFLSPQSNFTGLFGYLLAAILLGIVIYVIYINTEFIRSRKITKRFKTVNQWFNFLQLFHLSLIGVAFYCTVGPAIIAEFIYSDRINGQLRLLFFSFTFNLTYRPNDSDIYAGINLIPALYLYLFNLHVRQVENDEDFELDLFKTTRPRVEKSSTARVFTKLPTHPPPTSSQDGHKDCGNLS
jgi:hypothetical protein